MSNKEAYIDGMLHAASIADMEGSRRAGNAIRTVVAVMSGTPSKMPVEPIWQPVQGDRIAGGTQHQEDADIGISDVPGHSLKHTPKWFNEADKVKLLKACGGSKNLYGRCVYALRHVHTREAFVHNLSPIKGTGVKTEDALQRFRGMVWEV